MLKSTDISDRVRTATETLQQASIQAELTAVIGAAAHDGADRAAQRQPAEDDHDHGRGS